MWNLAVKVKPAYRQTGLLAGLHTVGMQAGLDPDPERAKAPGS
ncbi:hypothetical protein BMS3Abin10_02078 [bacterium BMS3Abin10]|nr:hypothetical protein BMS3Abin10_02078 [bacterium BMS3Abin10]GBE37988.1 hypothetical protein BMS3Bbin08_00587 [bacterium BMS3Bbin08]